MDSMLKRAAQEDSRLDLFASGGHPNELGHEYFTICPDSTVNRIIRKGWILDFIPDGKSLKRYYNLKANPE